MRNFFSSLSIVATLVTFVCVVIMFALGVWQLNRAEEKQARLISIQHASNNQQLSLRLALTQNLSELLDMPLKFDGSPNTKHYFLLDNKIHNGQVGYQVLVPVETALGVLIVNYGWVRATNSRSVLPEISISGQQKLYSGVISVPVNNAMVKETAIIDGNWPKVIQQPDLQVMQQHYQQPLLPFVVLLDADNQTPFIRKWQPVVMPPEKHIGYAIQWFLLGLAAVAVFAFANRNKQKRNSGE